MVTFGEGQAVTGTAYEVWEGVGNALSLAKKYQAIQLRTHILQLQRLFEKIDKTQGIKKCIVQV